MSRDARIATNFRTHPKRVKLQRRLGPLGVLAFVDLILFVADSRPNGVLTGLTPEDIAIASSWTGDPEEFVSALLDLGFFDRSEHGVLALHDWSHHNPYAATTDSRRLIAQASAHAGWLKRRGTTCNIKRCELCKVYASRNGSPMGTQREPNAPPPPPLPSPPPIHKIPAPSGPAKKSAKELVEEFVPTSDNRAWAAKKAPSVPVDAETEAWRDRMRQNGYRTNAGPVKDAAAAWRTAIRNAEAWGTYRKSGKQTNPPTPRPPKHSEVEEIMAPIFKGAK